MAESDLHNDLVVTLADLKGTFMCSKGTRAWCLKHGLSWSKGLKEGYKVSELVHIEDAMKDKVIAHVEKRVRLRDGK